MQNFTRPLPTTHKIDENLIPFLKSQLTHARDGLYFSLKERDYEEIGTRIMIVGEMADDPREFGKAIVANILEYFQLVADNQAAESQESSE